MSKRFAVYKHTSKNNKVYIGITSQEPQKRWKNGLGYKNNDYFYRSIQKYGWDNFRHEILFENLTEDEAIKKEAELINLFKSYMYEYGYNIKKASKGKEALTEETKAKISASNKKSGYTEARKNALKKAQEIIRNRPSEEHQNSKKVVCLNNNKIYPNIIIASKELNISRQSIQAICKKEIRHACGYIFLLYDEYLTTTKEQINCMFEAITKKRVTRNRKIICLTTGEVFNSINDAIEKYNIKNISSACRGVRKSAGKINGNPAKWMYYDEYTELNNSN